MSGLRDWLRALAWAALGLAVAAGSGVRAEPAGAGGARVTAIEARAEADGHLLTLDLSEGAPFTFFTLDEPRRLVIDFATRAAQDAGAAAELPKPFGTPRLGLFRADRGRVVIPLAEPLRVVRAAPLGDGRRIAIALRRTTGAEFSARAGWPAGARWDGGGMPLPPTRPGDGRLVVVIDPGHGGIDPGATVEGVVEKDVVLAFARRLARAVEATGEARAVLTRDADVFLPLGARVRLAQRAGAHVFVSVHADIVTEGDAAGFSIYTLAPEATDEAAAALAERENRADILAGAEIEGLEDDVTRVLIELAQRGAMAEADRLAAATLKALGPQIELLRSRPHREAEFRVLKAAEIPSILVELGFLTNAEDRARIVTPAWQAAAAQGVAQGILDWARGTTPAWKAPRG